MNPAISEAQISALVDTFYSKVRQDAEIGPIFNATVDDWPHHLSLLKDFWSSLLLATGRYKVDPMARHLSLGVDPEHFERWLALFAETVQEIFAPETSSFVIGRSHRIAQNLQSAISRAR